MPDPTRKTISATQVACLFGCSPYETEFSLYHWLRGVDIPETETGRMTWGKRMQPLLIQAATEDLKLEAVVDEKYVAFAGLPVGCTRDAIITCPDRGQGALEMKCVFDYRQWMTRWQGGTPPLDIELQIQVQMMVGDGNVSFKWGVIAVWLAGEITYFERKPEPELWEEIDRRVLAMLARVDTDNEPGVTGTEREEALLNKLYPATDPVSTIDIEDPDGTWVESLREWEYAKEQAKVFDKMAKAHKTKLLGLAKDHGKIYFQGDPGAIVDIKKTAIEGGTSVRKPHIRTTVSHYIPER